MKKVLFVATVVKTHINTFHIPYLKWFKNNGYEVHVAAKNDYENKEDCYIPYCDKYYDIPFERSPLKLNNLKSWRELKRIMDKNNYDIIHSHTPIGGVAARLSAIDSRKKGSKVIYTAHGFHFFKGAPILNWLLFYTAERWLARYTDTLITITKEDYKRAKNFKAKNIRYVPGVGVDTKKIASLKVDRNKKRQDLMIPKDSFLIISVGELNRNKNHEVAIRALGKIQDKNIHYAICGEGHLKKRLKNISIESGVADQVHFLGYREDVPEICLASDLFVFPSHREGLSVSVMEAMAAGLPIVGSDIRGNSELIKEEGGYLLPSRDIDSFSKAILKVYRQPQEKREEMGRYNQKEIKKYDLENVLKQMDKIYREI